jgi:hypothetical protein
MLVTSMACIPLAVKISGNWEANDLYPGHDDRGGGLHGGVPWGHIAGNHRIYALMFLTGIGLSSHYVIPWAIIPDTIESTMQKAVCVGRAPIMRSGHS